MSDGTRFMQVPQANRWCVYFNDESEPTGEVGHVCKAYKSGYCMMNMFTTSTHKHPQFIFTVCQECGEEKPEGLAAFIRLMLL